MKVVDVHCDLLYYYLDAVEPKDDDLGCSLYYLKGNVSVQTMAIYTATKDGSSKLGIRQSEIFRKLVNDRLIVPISSKKNNALNTNEIGAECAIENASSFCEESGSVEEGLKNLDLILDNAGPLFYIGLTHHSENRFGGGNNSDCGLKPDGEILIDYITSKDIAIDLAHSSDKLAYDILNFIDKRNYKTKVIASHSNSRVIQNNPRNLPDELIIELIKRKGLIGINFIKDYIDPLNPEKIFNHIDYILNLGGENCLCYGADFFNDKAHPDKSRYPFFFDEYSNASAYTRLNKRLIELYGTSTAEKISHRNAINFIENMWRINIF